MSCCNVARFSSCLRFDKLLSNQGAQPLTMKQISKYRWWLLPHFYKGQISCGWLWKQISFIFWCTISNPCSHMRLKITNNISTLYKCMFAENFRVAYGHNFPHWIWVVCVCEDIFFNILFIPFIFIFVNGKNKFCVNVHVFLLLFTQTLFCFYLELLLDGENLNL